MSKPGRRPPIQTAKATHDTPNLEPRAERLVAEYLRVWGLRDPQSIATLSRRWVRSALDESPSLDSGSSLTEVYRAVMQRAIADMEQWLHHLTDELCNCPRDARSRRGLLAIELQTVIDHFPAAMLDERPLSPSLRERLASAARPVVPDFSPTHMPTQSLDAVPTAQYFSAWRQAWKQIWHRSQDAASRQACGQD